MKYWEIENINANTFVGNEIKRFNVKSYGKIIITNDKWATGNWATRVGATEKTKAEAQAIVDQEVQTAQAAWDATPEADRLNDRPGNVVLP